MIRFGGLTKRQRSNIHAMTVAAVLLCGCDRPIAFPALQGITQVTVRTNHDRIVKTISEPRAVAAIVAFANAHRNGWRVPWAGVPVPQLVVEFHRGEAFAGHLGVGRTFFETQREGMFAAQPASATERAAFLALLEVQPEEDAR